MATESCADLSGNYPETPEPAVSEVLSAPGKVFLMKYPALFFAVYRLLRWTISTRIGRCRTIPPTLVGDVSANEVPDLKASDWRIEAAPEKKAYRVGEKVVLHVQLRNVSGQTQRAEQVQNLYDNFLLCFKKVNGNPVRWTPEFSRDHLPHLQSPGKNVRILIWDIPAGSSLKYTFELSAMYGLGEPGEYEVRLLQYTNFLAQLMSLRPFYTDGKIVSEVRIESPKRTFRVLPDANPPLSRPRKGSAK